MDSDCCCYCGKALPAKPVTLACRPETGPFCSVVCLQCWWEEQPVVNTVRTRFEYMPDAVRLDQPEVYIYAICVGDLVVHVSLTKDPVSVWPEVRRAYKDFKNVKIKIVEEARVVGSHQRLARARSLFGVG